MTRCICKPNCPKKAWRDKPYAYGHKQAYLASLPRTYCLEGCGQLCKPGCKYASRRCAGKVVGLKFGREMGFKYGPKAGKIGGVNVHILHPNMAHDNAVKVNQMYPNMASENGKKSMKTRAEENPNVFSEMATKGAQALNKLHPEIQSRNGQRNIRKAIEANRKRKGPTKGEGYIFESCASRNLTFLPYGKIWLEAAGRDVETDALLPEYKVALFSDGDYYHGCPIHRPGEYLIHERIGNEVSKRRTFDKFENKELTKIGWTVLRAWQCEFKKDHDIMGKKLDALNLSVKRMPTLDDNYEEKIS